MANSCGLAITKARWKKQAQEAIIIFKNGTETESAVQQTILKIRVTGDVDHFAWVVPMPNTPKVEKADAKLFEELFRYVQVQQRRSAPSKGQKSEGDAKANTASEPGVTVIKREVVGSYNIAIVKEKQERLTQRLADRQRLPGTGKCQRCARTLP